MLLEISIFDVTGTVYWYTGDRRTKVLNIIRQHIFPNDVAKNMAKEVKKKSRGEIELGKSKLTEYLAEKIIVRLILQKRRGNQ